MYFLEAEEVVKQFSGHLALDKVTIQVPPGKIFGLLGPNGAGKTTLLRIINRITAPDSGSIRFNGRESRPEDVFRIGYMPEERGLYKKMKVGEQAIYLARLKGLSYQEAKKRLTDWFDKFEITSWWNRRLEELSKGMQQKIQFIITVIHKPELLIFDEPFSGFDPVNADRVKQEIIELKYLGHTIIFSTHNMASVEEICDEIALIDHSRVVLSGEVNEIRNRFRLNTLSVTLRWGGGIFSIDSPYYTVLSAKAQAGEIRMRIQKNPGVRNSDIITELSRSYEIMSFVEELPSMNDVFINTVSGTNSTQA
ncbi:MAG: ATP-binding cassette domain-containing protein [Tannerellaceae bacterium]|jgi:ABC-2 type transport system ATP-binding protein|nr:ATP-binding cassette domain-containing protein [Tannerellaceae bacterium]